MTDAIPEDARYEIKFVADATRYREIERWILLNAACFRTAYPPRRDSLSLIACRISAARRVSRSDGESSCPSHT